MNIKTVACLYRGILHGNDDDLSPQHTAYVKRKKPQGSWKAQEHLAFFCSSLKNLYMKSKHKKANQVGFLSSNIGHLREHTAVLPPCLQPCHRHRTRVLCSLSFSLPHSAFVSSSFLLSPGGVAQGVMANLVLSCFCPIPIWGPLPPSPWLFT